MERKKGGGISGTKLIGRRGGDRNNFKKFGVVTKVHDNGVKAVMGIRRQKKLFGTERNEDHMMRTTRPHDEISDACREAVIIMGYDPKRKKTTKRMGIPRIRFMTERI